MSTAMIWQTKSTGSADTERLGELIGSSLKGSETIELRSDLGGGKTTFVRGLAKGFGSRGTVVSPTFTLNRIYEGPRGRIAHFDFYRLGEPGILRDQLAEFLDDRETVVVVEWSDIVRDVLPPNRLSIEFQPVASNADERQITLSYPPAKQPLIAELEANWTEVEP